MTGLRTKPVTKTLENACVWLDSLETDVKWVSKKVLSKRPWFYQIISTHYYLCCLCYQKMQEQSKEVKFDNSIRVFYTKLYIRRLMGSTYQADPRCIYFRISWILMERQWFYFFLSPPLVAGPQKYKHKIGHKYFTF